MSTLHLLGTGGYHPTEQRHTPCLMLPEAGIVLDAGTAFFRVRELIATDRLDIFLSHAHLDHCCGLTFLIDVLWKKDVREVVLHARPQDLDAVRTGLFDSPLFPVSFDHVVRPIEQSLALGGWTVRHREQEHPGGSLGFRLDNERRSIAYVTDTTANAGASDSIEFVRGVDVLIHECYFSDEYAALARRSGHSTVTEVAGLAAAAGVGRLVLVHVNPLAGSADIDRLAEVARRIFPATTIGLDGMTIET